MLRTPNANRLHIGLFGRRNVGKSALLNALTRQDVSIVSDVAGTTTDPVEKPMELQPLGPVLFIDTAGVDDLGALGVQRVERTRRVFDRTDLAVIVAAGDWGLFEDSLLTEFAGRETPVVVAFNKADLGRPSDDVLRRLAEARVPAVLTSAIAGEGLSGLRETLIRSAPEAFLAAPPLIGDLVSPGALVVLVTPIDKEAPKGRLILPQVQTIRDLLDHDAMALVVKERELGPALGRLKEPPALVVTDSQAFLKVAADIPPDVPMTSFSILFARQKGDLVALVRRRDGDRRPPAGRPRAGLRGLQPSSDRRRHRPREDPPVAHAIRRHAARVRPPSRPRFPRRPEPIPDRDPLRRLRAEPAGDGLAHRPLSRGRRTGDELRPDHRLYARHLRAGALAVSGGAGGLPRAVGPRGDPGGTDLLPPPGTQAETAQLEVS